MKILLTGAHFTTAQAVIVELKKQQDIEIVYVGRNTTREGDFTPSVESQILPKMGVKFIPVITGRLQRTFTLYTIPSILKIPIGFLQSFFIILQEKPDIVLSFGGYVSVPIVITSWFWSVPILMHEQTLITGLANKINSLFADKIYYAFKENNFSKKKNALLIGNPIRKEILNFVNHLDGAYDDLLKTAKREKLPVILVTGGNQGSHIINQSIEDCLDKLLKVSCVIHQTGDSKYQDFERLSKAQTNHYVVKKWIGEEIGAILSRVDLVVSRAGINTLSEIVYMQKVALVIPIDYLYQNEQNKNANFFAKFGSIKILPQKNLSGDTLFESIKVILKDLQDLKKKAKINQEIVIPDAAKRLALEVLLYAV